MRDHENKLLPKLSTQMTTALEQLASLCICEPKMQETEKERKENQFPQKPEQAT